MTVHESSTGLATFLLVLSGGFFIVASASVALLCRERKAFEIRARSAYLTILTGLSFLAIIVKLLVNQVKSLHDMNENMYLTQAVKYFAVVCSTCCYGSRTIRLALLYSAKARKAMPWLVRERNHVAVCLICGLFSMAMPLSEYGSIAADDAEAVADFDQRSDRYLWIVTVACEAVLIALNPIAWMVDDIFNLSLELRIFVVVLLLQIVAGLLAKGGGEIEYWIQQFVLEALVMFSVSVIYPVTQRLRHPMENGKPAELKSPEHLRTASLSIKCLPWCTTLDSTTTDSVIEAAAQSGGFNANGGGVGTTVVVDGASTIPGVWTYERVASMPAVFEAFEEFSRKALCQESVIFLKSVTTYQNQRHGDEECKYDDEDGDERGHRMGEGSKRGQREQFLMFSEVVREHITDGSPNEINLSSTDKKNVMAVYNLGEQGFYALPARTRRFVFAPAYSEIRSLLEKNLMAKFLRTERFQTALTKDRTTQNHPGTR